MTLRRPLVLLAALLSAGLVLSACDSTGVNPSEDDGDLPLTRVEDLPADPPPANYQGRPPQTGRHTFFSLRDSSIVLRYDNTESRSDSASTDWDLAFQSTNILVNGGTSGPGQGAAYVAEAAFQNVDEVDTDRLASDDASEGSFAIPQGSDGWYSYNANGNNVVRPVAGRTIVVRAASGDAYAKIRILSYYEGNPSDPADSDAAPRYYTFEYVLSDDPSFE
jgi:hypothetical protein